MNGVCVEDLTVRYGSFTAIKALSVAVPRGSTLGIAGESGSGKTTLARAIVGLAPITGGRVALDGKDIAQMPAKQRRQVQMIFQDSTSALNPQMTAGASIAEALAGRTRSEIAERVAKLLEVVRLDRGVAAARPHELSGGQRQRVAIARALAAEPAVLIADEITSALDVSVQASILNLLRELHESWGLTLIFISHNLAAVRYVSARVAIMYLGEIVELAPTQDFFSSPRHPYSVQLLSAVPTVSQSQVDRTELHDVDIPDAHARPAGCSFHPRCPVGPMRNASRQVCATADPHLGADTRPNRAACHFAV